MSLFSHIVVAKCCFIHYKQQKHDVYKSGEKTVHKKDCEIMQHLQHFIFSKGCTDMNSQIVIDPKLTAE